MSAVQRQNLKVVSQSYSFSPQDEALPSGRAKRVSAGHKDFILPTYVVGRDATAKDASRSPGHSRFYDNVYRSEDRAYKKMPQGAARIRQQPTTQASAGSLFFRRPIDLTRQDVVRTMERVLSASAWERFSETTSNAVATFTRAQTDLNRGQFVKRNWVMAAVTAVFVQAVLQHAGFSFVDMALVLGAALTGISLRKNSDTAKILVGTLSASCVLMCPSILLACTATVGLCVLNNLVISQMSTRQGFSSNDARHAALPLTNALVAVNVGGVLAHVAGAALCSGYLPAIGASFALLGLAALQINASVEQMKLMPQRDPCLRAIDKFLDDCFDRSTWHHLLSFNGAHGV